MRVSSLCRLLAAWTASVSIAALFTGFLENAGAQDITYNIVNYPDNQPDIPNGGTDIVSGTITTDGNLGAITSSDILSWNWTITSSKGAYTLSSSDANSSFGVAPYPLEATSSQLLLPQGATLFVPDGSSYMVYYNNSLATSNGSVQSAYAGIVNISGSYPAWFQQAPVPTTPGSIGANEPWIIGVTGNGTSAAPYQPTTVSSTGSKTMVTVTQPNQTVWVESTEGFNGYWTFVDQSAIENFVTPTDVSIQNPSDPSQVQTYPLQGTFTVCTEYTEDPDIYQIPQYDVEKVAPGGTVGPFYNDFIHSMHLEQPFPYYVDPPGGVGLEFGVTYAEPGTYEIDVTPTPEPSTAALLTGLGALAVMRLARRRRAKAAIFKRNSLHLSTPARHLLVLLVIGGGLLASGRLIFAQTPAIQDSASVSGDYLFNDENPPVYQMGNGPNVGIPALGNPLSAQASNSSFTDSPHFSMAGGSGQAMVSVVPQVVYQGGKVGSTFSLSTQVTASVSGNLPQETVTAQALWQDVIYLGTTDPGVVGHTLQLNFISDNYANVNDSYGGTCDAKTALTASGYSTTSGFQGPSGTATAATSIDINAASGVLTNSGWDTFQQSASGNTGTFHVDIPIVQGQGAIAGVPGSIFYELFDTSQANVGGQFEPASAAAGDPLQFQSITLPDVGNVTPESLGVSVSFASGISSPDIPSVPATAWAAATSGNWSDATKWTNGAPNGTGAQAIINVPTASPLTVTLDAPVTLGGLLLGNSANSATGYTLAGTNALTFNNSGSGATIAVTDGSHAINAPVILADNLAIANTGCLAFGAASSLTDNGAGYSLNVAGPGKVVLAGSVSLAGGMTIDGGTIKLPSSGNLSLRANLVVGSSGSGTFVQCGGANSVGGLVLAQGQGSSGTYNHNGGLLLVGSGGIAAGTGTAIFNLGGGTLAATAPWSSSVPMTLTGNGGGATIDTTGGNIALCGVLSGSGGLDKVGPNTLTLSASNTFSGNLTVDGGTLAMPGGTLGTANQYIGYSGGGSLVQSGGTNSANNNLYLGYNSGSSGAYVLSGGLLSAGFEWVGVSGSGSFSQTGGTNSFVQLVVGTGNGGSDVYELNAGVLISTTPGYGEYIGDGGPGAFTQSGGANILAHNFGLCVGFNAPGTYTFTGGSISVPYENIGVYYGAGSFTQCGGTNSVDALSLGSGFASISGTYSLNAGLLLATTAEYIGLYGAGTFSQSGGVNSVGSGGLNLGYYAGSNGSYYLCGNGLLLALTEQVGVAGSGIFTQSGGTNSVSGSLYLDNGGSYLLSGNAVLTALHEAVGLIGSATFAQSGGTNMVSAELDVGLGYGGSGAYTLSGGSLFVPGNLNVGNGGNGSVVQTGGVATVSGSAGLVVGVGQPSSPQGTGSYALSGGSLSATNELVGDYNGVGIVTQSGGINSAPAEVVGASGVGSYVQTGGSNSVGAGLSIGQADSGAYSLSGSGVIIAAAETVGGWGYGSFAQAAGTNAVGSLVVGTIPSGSGAYNLSGVGLLTATEEFVGYNGPASFTQSGGTNSVSSLAIAQQAGSTGTYNLSGGLLAANQILAGAGSGVLNFSGGTIAIGGQATVTAPIDLNNPFGTGTINVAGSGSSVTISGAISGPGGLAKAGPGMLVLTGNESFTGTFQASDGTVQFDGASAVLGPGSIRASSGAVVQYTNAFIQGGFLRGPGMQTTLLGTSNYFSGTTTYASTLFLQNGTDTFTNFTNGGQVTNNAPLVWDGGVNNAGANLTVDSNISTDDFTNAGVITINAGGAINNHLSDVTSYGGGRITVNSGGTLNADSQGEGVALDLQDSLLVNNGTVAGTTNVYYGATAQGSGTFGLIDVYEGGTLLISPSFSPVAPAAVVSGGGIAGAGTSALPITTDGAYLVAANATDQLTLSGDISGSGSITKLGAGTLVLSGTDKYQGATFVDAGTLVATNNEALPDGSSLIVGNASLFPSYAPVIAAAAATPVPEPGTIALLAVTVCAAATYRSVPSRRRE